MHNQSLRRPIVRLALNQSEVALAIGVSANSVAAMVEDGLLPAPRRWRSRKLWLVSEIEVALSELPVDGVEESNPWDGVIDFGPPPGPARSRKTAMDGRRQSDMRNASPEELHRYGLEQAARWREAVLAGSLNKREEDALRRLAGKPEGKLVTNAVVRIGPDTAERLELRGYIELQWEDEAKSRIRGYVLLPAGQEAARAKRFR